MVSQFIIDYMHNVCLGVVKYFIDCWVSETYGVNRIGAANVRRIDKNLVKYAAYCPIEFSRCPAKLSDFRMWKATQFRQFVCYTFVAACRKVFEPERYKHFCMLVVAMRILLNSTLNANNNHVADELLKKFVKLTLELYGEDMGVYNLHMLSHLAEEANRHGCLDTISSFPFESYMSSLKRYIHTGRLPLQQVVYRVLEERSVNCNSDGPCQDPQFYMCHEEGPLIYNQMYNHLETTEYDSVQSNGIRYGRGKRNSCVQFEDNIGVIQNVLLNRNRILLVLKVFKNLADAFEYPLHSMMVGIYKAWEFRANFQLVHLNQCHKCFLMPICRRSDSYIVISLNNAMV